MPIVEIYNIDLKICDSDFELLANKIGNCLGIPKRNIWFLHHKISDITIYKGNEYNRNSPIIFFNCKQKHAQEKIKKVQHELANGIAVIAKCRPEDIFCGVRRIADEEVYFPSLF